MTRPAFQQLADAVAFLATQLDRGTLDQIADACADYGEESRWYRLSAIDVLAERHREADLRVLYRDRSFPDSEAKFKLGGHGAELGHLHIDFARASEGWQLANIFICR